ncbi:MAG: DotD/TraH family lipoprotein [Pseudomonadota bacterium]
MSKQISYLLVALVMGLSGCTNNWLRVASQSETERSLLATAAAIDRSLRTLEAYEYAAKPQLLDAEHLMRQDERLARAVSLDWSGPIEPLLEKIVDMSDYRLRILGARPVIPVMVNVSTSAAKLAELIKDLGLQSGKRADLVVFPDAHIIELRYLSS